MADKYVRVEEAAAMSGLRLVVTQGAPGPWGEAAKGILYVKGLDHVRVAQVAGGPNIDLLAWIGMNHAPILVLDDQPPRSGWVEILMLAERLAPAPRLIPEDESDRAAMFGLAHELCAEDGFGWNRRLMFFIALERSPNAQPAVGDRASFDRMMRKYGYGGSLAQCRARIVAILQLLAAKLVAQSTAGSNYYMGDVLSALDIYSACFMVMIQPLPLDLCPTSIEMHANYHERDPEIIAAVDPILLRHRDYIYTNYLEVPMRM